MTHHGIQFIQKTSGVLMIYPSGERRTLLNATLPDKNVSEREKESLLGRMIIEAGRPKEY